MERKEYIDKAMRYAATGSHEFLVKWNGELYIPMAYTIKFRGDGSALHVARLRDMRAACSVADVPLAEVEEVQE